MTHLFRKRTDNIYSRATGLTEFLGGMKSSFFEDRELDILFAKEGFRGCYRKILRFLMVSFLVVLHVILR